MWYLLNTFLFFIQLSFSMFPLYASKSKIPKIYVNAEANTEGTNYQKQGKTFEKLIDMTPGVWIANQGIPGTPMTTNFQGLKGSYTQVLMDGNQLNQGSTEQTNLSSLTELGSTNSTFLSGPSIILQSGQVANILQFDSHYDQQGTDGHFEGGSFQTNRFQVRHTKRYENFIPTVFVSQESTGGISQENRDRIYGERNKYKQQNGGLISTLQLSDQTSLKASMKVHESTLHYDGGMIPLSPKPTDQYDHQLHLFGLEKFYTSFNHGYSDSMSIHHMDEKNIYNRFSKDKSSLSHIVWRPNYKWNSQHCTNVTLEEIINRIHTSNFRKLRTMGGFAFLHAYQMTDHLELEVGGRQDYSQNLHIPFKGTAGFSWSNQKTKIFGSWRQAGRIPTLSEQYQRTPYFIPNANIKAEKINMHAVGLEQEILNNWIGRFTYFYHQLHHPILVQEVKPFQYSMHNVNHQYHVHGTETWMKYTMSESVNVEMQYTHIELPPKPYKTSVPQNHFQGNIQWNFANYWSFKPNVQYVGERQGFNRKLKPYVLMGIHLAYDLKKNTQLFLKVENMWDERYEMMENFQPPRRGIYVGTSFSF